MKTGKERILEISKKYKLSHIGSNLSSYEIIKEIYQIKKPDEKFILSNGHAGIALYVVLEENGGRNAEAVFKDHGIHATKCEECNITCSTGSLGHGIGVAVGIALADKEKNVYCLISDGETMEGSVWEALRIAKELKLDNLKIYVNANGWGGLRQINRVELFERLYHYPVRFIYTNNSPLKDNLEAHYEKVI